MNITCYQIEVIPISERANAEVLKYEKILELIKYGNRHAINNLSQPRNWILSRRSKDVSQMIRKIFQRFVG